MNSRSLHQMLRSIIDFLIISLTDCKIFLQDDLVNEEDRINSPTEERMADLTQRLEGSEMEAQRMSDALEQMTAQNAALERDVQSLQNDNDRLRGTNDALAAEKWELSAANADLQNRLQAVSYMQVFKYLIYIMKSSKSYIFTWHTIQIS